jgi:small subunit ribosomal protein S16
MKRVAPVNPEKAKPKKKRVEREAAEAKKATDLAAAKAKEAAAPAA